MDKNLIIVRGIPGSGKSTFAKLLSDGQSNLICEADEFFIDSDTGEYKFDRSKLKDAHEYCRNKVERMMKFNLLDDQLYTKIIVSNTSTMEWEMDSYFLLAEKYGYKIFSIIVENRHDGINSHGVSEEKIEEMKKRFQIKL